LIEKPIALASKSSLIREGLDALGDEGGDEINQVLSSPSATRAGIPYELRTGFLFPLTDRLNREPVAFGDLGFLASGDNLGDHLGAQLGRVRYTARHTQPTFGVVLVIVKSPSASQ